MSELDRMTLYQLYVEEQLTIRAIADKLSIRQKKVYDAMMRWRIPRRPSSIRLNRLEPKFPFDEATLRHLYHEVGQTIKEIAAQFNISYGRVFSAMKYWGVPRRRRGPKPKRQLPKSS
jgi:predicted DNA-binding protein YlxM (UPF0122 family)